MLTFPPPAPPPRAPVSLVLQIETVADIGLDRARAIARAFDAHPDLRPRKVGGDPARIRVDPSLEAIVEKYGLPLDLLTFRENEPTLEMGELTLLTGRGGYVGVRSRGEQTSWSLTGNRVVQKWSANVFDDEAQLREVSNLFEKLVVASDAMWGAVGLMGHVLPTGASWQVLPEPLWLNYFGPAFVARFPELMSLTSMVRRVGRGVLVHTSDKPLWLDAATEAGAPLRAVFPPKAFIRQAINPALPSQEEQLAMFPGTQEMPWEAHVQADAAKALARARAKKHARARAKLTAQLAAREIPVVHEPMAEWSTSLDRDDLGSFFAGLKRGMRGELASPIGTAVKSVIETAPLDEEEEVHVHTDIGVVRIGWFADDVDAIDIYVSGPSDIEQICFAAAERN